MFDEKDDELINSGVKIRKYQLDWLARHESFNLSGFVREKLDEVIKESEAKQ